MIDYNFGWHLSTSYPPTLISIRESLHHIVTEVEGIMRDVKVKSLSQA